MNKRIQLLLGITVLLIVVWQVWLIAKAKGGDWLPVKYVRIEGAFQYISKEKIKTILQKQVSSGLYNANIQQIQQSVNNLPWVGEVTVKRVWPDALNIKIIEQTPVARWGVDGLINGSGEVFIPDNINEFSQLPLITGPEGNENKLLEVMIGLNVALRDQQMQLAEFHVNDRRAWSIKLRRGMRLILGRNEPLDKFQIFLTTLTLLGDEQVVKVASVDLRYPNGYALTWKSGEEEIDWKTIVEMKKI